MRRSWYNDVRFFYLMVVCMKRLVRMMLLGMRLLVVVWCALMWYEMISIVLGIAWIGIAPRISQRCLRFSPDALTLIEECLAWLLSSLTVCVVWAVWITFLGYPLSLYTLLIRVAVSVAISFFIIWFRSLGY